MFTLRIYTMMRNVDLPSELLTSMAMPPHSNVPEAEQTELEIIWAQNIDNVTKLRRYKKTAVFLFAWKGTDLREVESEVNTTIHSKWLELIKSRSVIYPKYSRQITISKLCRGLLSRKVPHRPR